MEVVFKMKLVGEKDTIVLGLGDIVIYSTIEEYKRGESREYVICHVQEINRKSERFFRYYGNSFDFAWAKRYLFSSKYINMLIKEDRLAVLKSSNYVKNL